MSRDTEGEGIMTNLASITPTNKQFGGVEEGGEHGDECQQPFLIKVFLLEGRRIFL